LVQADNTLSNRLAAAENNNKTLSDKIAKLESDLKDMAKKNAEQPDGKKCDVNASFDNIEFGFGTAVIDKASYATLDQVAEVLKNNKVWSKLEIGGNADNIGDSNYNLTLSQKRAEAVKAYLVNKGLSESALIAKGYGEENPIATNDTPEGRQQNRRVDFKVSK
jgi:outer membrane protein OmpA-like peptidoglycan-associated protein